MDAGPPDRCERESVLLVHFSAARLISDHIIAQEEYGLLTELAPLNSPNALSSTYATLISPLTALFTSTLGSLGSLIKHNLNKNTFLALSTYPSLSELQTPWTEIMSKRADRKDNELKEGLHSIRASCLRSFPEFLADMRLAGLGKGGETGTGLAEFTITVRGSHIRAAGVAADTDRPWFMVWTDCHVPGTASRGERCRRVCPAHARRWELADGRRHAGREDEADRGGREDRARAFHLYVPRLPLFLSRSTHTHHPQTTS